MSTPVLHVLAGPNGSGKSSFAFRVLQPTTGLPFINADVIAAARWPGQELQHAYEASRAAAAEREQLLRERRSFITETVFSHPSKVALIGQALAADYLVTLHVMLLPVEVTVQRVRYRVDTGGHQVPEDKIRERYVRLWPLVAAGAALAQHAVFYDNSRAARPFRPVARFQRGRPISAPEWPEWTPAILREAASPAG